MRNLKEKQMHLADHDLVLSLHLQFAEILDPMTPMCSFQSRGKIMSAYATPPQHSPVLGKDRKP